MTIEDLTFALESATLPVGRACLTAYFAELDARFEGGFDLGSALGEIGAEFRAPGGAFLVARAEGSVCGCGGFVALGAEVAEIKRVWIAPPVRGQGVARRLIEALEREARARGFRRLRLDTNRALVEAQAMYRKAGYHEIGRYNDNPHAHHWFEKAL